MVNRPNLVHQHLNDGFNTRFECPHCGTHQATVIHRHSFVAFLVDAVQCTHCKDLTIRWKFGGEGNEWLRIYPEARPWRGMTFQFAPGEVLKAYDEARLLYTIHTGAAGAYARRALEFLLDNVGYAEKTLDAAIKAAKLEENKDRQLPKRLLQKLDYIREIGNFAIHTRRDAELVIVEIDEEEVAACLETVEELIEYIYEEPVDDYTKTHALNVKLVAAGKKPIELPPLPPGVTVEMLNLTEKGE